jgi:hypothetical protein
MLLFKQLFTYFKACCSIGSKTNEHFQVSFNVDLSNTKYFLMKTLDVTESNMKVAQIKSIYNETWHLFKIIKVKEG